jgi:uncharacterized phage protein (TIGR01671 family)
MQELKCRVWDKRDQKMREVTELYWSTKEICCIEDTANGEHDVLIPWDEYAVLMMAIGTKDKRSKEIFEGDILGWQYLEEGSGVVKYSDVYASYEPFNQLRLERVKTFEIIGNIYENPEVLQ